MNLTHVQEGTEHIVKAIVTDDEEMDAFLFSLGCYAGEPITVVRRVRAAVWYPSRMVAIISTIIWQRPLR